ncbi:MAG: hypothetical protein VZQ55_02750 [Ruminococcus sp.]|nr:hypothetical protein [Ruminococcus sp.]
MNIYMISNTFIWICSLVSFIVGAIMFFKPSKPLFAKMITMAIGCIAFGRIFQVVRLMTDSEALKKFQLGFLGVIGSLVFLFAVNFCIVDKAVDDRSPKNQKYRFIPIVFPILAAAFYMIFIGFADVNLIVKICGAVLTLFVVQSIYFNAKHIFFPDLETGVLGALKPYNILALIYAYLCLAEIIALSGDYYILDLALSFVMGIVIILLIPAVAKGVKKWKI